MLFDDIVKIDLNNLTLETINKALAEKMKEVTAAKQAAANNSNAEANEKIKDLEEEYIALNGYLMNMFLFAQCPDKYQNDPSQQFAQKILVSIKSATSKTQARDEQYKDFVKKLNNYEDKLISNPQLVFIFADRFIALSMKLAEKDRKSILPEVEAILAAQREMHGKNDTSTILKFFLSKYKESEGKNTERILELEREKTNLQRLALKIKHNGSVRSTYTSRTFFRSGGTILNEEAASAQPPHEIFDDCIMASIYWTRSRATLLPIILKHYRFQAENFTPQSPRQAIQAPPSAKDFLFDLLLNLCNEKMNVPLLLSVIRSNTLLKSTNIVHEINLAKQANCFQDIKSDDPMPGRKLAQPSTEADRDRLKFKLQHLLLVFKILSDDNLIPTSNENIISDLRREIEECEGATIVKVISHSNHSNHSNQ